MFRRLAHLRPLPRAFLWLPPPRIRMMGNLPRPQSRMLRRVSRGIQNPILPKLILALPKTFPLRIKMLDRTEVLRTHLHWPWAQPLSLSLS